MRSERRLGACRDETTYNQRYRLQRGCQEDHERVFEETTGRETTTKKQYPQEDDNKGSWSNAL
jgi:uncharacterized protein VirK/YbjX